MASGQRTPMQKRMTELIKRKAAIEKGIETLEKQRKDLSAEIRQQRKWLKECGNEIASIASSDEWNERKLYREKKNK